MWRSRWKCVIKPAYSFSFLLSINIFVWQNVLYFLDAPCTIYLLFLTSRNPIRVDSSPANATGLRSWRSLWYGQSVSVPLPRCVSPCAIRTINRLLGSFAWNCANWRSIAANLQKIHFKIMQGRAHDATELSIFLCSDHLCCGTIQSGRYKWYHLKLQPSSTLDTITQKTTPQKSPNSHIPCLYMRRSSSKVS